MEKKCFKGVLRGFLWMAAWAVAGYLLLVLVYCLPVDRMQTHLESCVDAFRNGPTTLLKDDTAMWIDYLTDSTILAEAVYDGEESPWNQAAAVYSSAVPEEGEENWTYKKVQASLEDEQQGLAYPRYWHGFLVYLKPLLSVFDYKDILTLNMLAQLLLMLYIAQLFVKQNGGGVRPFAPGGGRFRYADAARYGPLPAIYALLLCHGDRLHRPAPMAGMGRTPHGAVLPDNRHGDELF